VKNERQRVQKCSDFSYIAATQERGILMKIWGDNPKVYGVYSKLNPAGKVTAKGNVASRKDEFSISGLAKEYQVALKALRNVPDIRMDKVQEISRKIERGEYNVSAEDIAEKMLQTLLRGRI